MRKIMLLFAFLGLIGMQVFAQKTITGTVSSADDGSNLPGVAVVVKGTNIATVSDMDGKYVLNNVPDDATALVFSLMGMEEQEVAISGDVVDCALNKKDVELTGVVVTALGIKRDEKALGYGVQEVSGDDLNTVKSGNFVSQLSGKVAGVQIQTNTNFGGSTNILVRGSSSITGGNQALFVVDGVPVNNSTFNTSYQSVGGRGYDYGNAVSDINPDDIESITVLKGASATALYGSRASNGVVLITTKKGSLGKALGVDISFNASMGIVDKSTFPEYQNLYGAGYGPFYDDPTGMFFYYDVDGDGTSDLVTPTSEDASYGAAFDPTLMVYQWDAFYPGLDNYMTATPWVAAENTPLAFFDNSKTFNTSVQVAGGSDKATYRVSYQNFLSSGIMPNSHMTKNNISFAGSYNIAKNIKISSFANYVNTNTYGRNNTGYSGNIMSSFRQWWQTNVDILEQKDAYDLLQSNVTWNPTYGDLDMDPIYWNNFYYQVYENYEQDTKDRFVGYTQLDWDFTDYLSFTARAAIDHYNTLQEERLAVGSVAEAFGIGYPDQLSGYLYRTYDFTETNMDFFLTFHKDFSDNFNVRAVVGSNLRHTELDYLLASTNGGLVVPDLYALTNSTESPLAPIQSASKYQVNGYFGNLSLGFLNAIYLEGAVRVDQSSTLPIDNNTYFYPSVSGSFIFSEFLDADWLSLGKLRLSYAEVGSSAPFASLNDVYSQGTSFNGLAVFGVPTTKLNPELRPERKKSIETGLTLNFFKSRVGLDVSLYKDNGIDLIMPAAVSQYTGYSTKYINAGNIENKGIEVMLNVVPVKTSSGLEWNMTLNWSKNVNLVKELAEGVDNLQLASLQGGVSINARVGEPYGTIQGTDFIYSDENNKIPANRVISSTGNYMKTSTSDQIIGNVQPDWIGGLRNTVSFKGLTLSFLIDWKHGGDIFSLDQWYGMATGLYPETAYINDLGNNVRDDIVGDAVNGYDPTSGGVILEGQQMVVTGTDTTYEVNNVRAYAGWFANPWGYYRAPNALHVYDASYVKLREVTVNYDLPKSLFNSSFIGGINIGFVGSNLWLIHSNLPYADPEATQGAGNIQGWQSGVLPSTRNFGFSLKVKF